VHQSPTRIQHASNSVCDAQGLKQTSDGFPRTDTSSAPRPTASALSEGRDRAGSDVTVRPGRLQADQRRGNRVRGQVLGVNSFYYPVFMLGSFFLVFIPAIHLLRRPGHNPVWCLLAIAGIDVIPCGR